MSATGLSAGEHIRALAERMTSHDRRGNRLAIRIRGRIVTKGASVPDQCSAEQVVAAILAHEDAQVLVLQISSEGGELNAYEEMARSIRDFRGRSVSVVDDVAGSAAALLAIACDRVIIRRGARIMFHRTQIQATGNCEYLREKCRFLSMQDAKFLGQLRRRVGVKHEREMRDAFESERWLSAEDAFRMGISDAIAPSLLASTGATANSISRNVDE